MTDTNNLFFELIRVAIGNAVCLSHTPSADEWGELYAMAKKQSLVGVCFSGVQKLQKQRQCPPEMLYLRWMGMAAKIQQRNEVVNRQCVDVQKMLAADGFKTSILKGQGIATLYCEQLRGLRQSGDIDVWVQGGMDTLLPYCRKKYGTIEYDYINAHVPVFDDTEVELHWRVHSLPNLFANKQLQKWFCKQEKQLLEGKAILLNSGSIVVPNNEFNAFFILLHCYHHMFESGLGLRQLMDYYFVLIAYANEKTSTKLSTSSRELSVKFSVNALLKEFGMMRFAKGSMWIMHEVFGLEREYMLCEPNEKEGRFLLKEIMQNGNFRHHDVRKHGVKNKWIEPFITRLQHNWHLVTHYPSEFLWAPVWLVWHYVWKRNLKLNN